MTTADPALFTGPVRGAVVIYHGSRTGCHGECFYQAPGRLMTVSHGQRLHRVRRESYDVVPVPVTDVVRKGHHDHVYHWAAPADPRRAACGRTRLDDATAALPHVVCRQPARYDLRCTRPACARRWSQWHQQTGDALRALLS